MTQKDARFEDGREAPVNIGALDEEALNIVSALVQDSVFSAADMSWGRTRRRFALLVNRFRWEDAGRDRHAPERVRTILIVDHVMSVASQGISRDDPDLILSLLSISWQPGEDGAGQLLLTLAGDGAIRLDCEALEVGLRDVTRPYRAVSGKAPDHDT